MESIQIDSASPPFDEPAAAHLSVRAIGTADAMGILGDAKTLRVLDERSFAAVLQALERAGIGHGWTVKFASAKRNPKALREFLTTVGDALEASPVPQHEWARLAEILSMDLLMRLVSISQASFHRYHSGERQTPDAIAERVHFLALLVGELSGSYNDIGIRRWFDRPRVQLGNKTPAAVLAGEWAGADAGPKRVRALARSLLGAGAT